MPVLLKPLTPQIIEFVTDSQKVIYLAISLYFAYFLNKMLIIYGILTLLLYCCCIER